MEETGGLAESNGSPPPGGWLKVTCGQTACKPGSAPGPTLVNDSIIGKLPLPLTLLTLPYNNLTRASAFGQQFLRALATIDYRVSPAHVHR